MTAIPLGVGHYVRQAGKLPPIFVTNMYIEKDPSNLVDGLVRLPRPGLNLFTTAGNGPIREVFRQAGTFNGDYLVTSGDALYRISGSGSVASLSGYLSTTSARTITAASATKALVADGINCFSTNGSTATLVVMPSAEKVSSVAHINGYFILAVTDSNRFFWIAPGETNPDALNFASAENSPDNILRVVRFLDELWFMGQSSIEVWQATGNSDLPFARIGGRLYERGIASRDAVAILDNTLFFVGDDLIVYRAEAAPVRISDHSIEERLQQNTGALSCWAFSHAGHTFLSLRIGNQGTFIYDVENGNWLRWRTYGREPWRAWNGAQNGAQVIAGDDANGTLWQLDATKFTDNGIPIIREIMGGVAALGNPVRCNSVRLFCATGHAALNTEPVIELNWYDDGGFELDGPWMPMSLGKQGDYYFEVIARQLGLIYSPGRLFHIRMSDDALFRLSFARMNED